MSSSRMSAFGTVKEFISVGPTNLVSCKIKGKIETLKNMKSLND